MEGYSSFAGCTLEALRFISEADITYKGKKVNLQDEYGNPKINRCMHLMGFDSKYEKIKVFRKEGDRRTKETNPYMLVRHPLKLDRAQWCEVYAGRMREDYVPPDSVECVLKGLAFTGDIIHVPNESVCVLVEEFGEDYIS